VPQGPFARVIFSLSILILIHLCATPTARAATQAEQFQANQDIHTPGIGNLNSYLDSLIHSQPRNIERAWPDTQADPPPGSPPGANRVLITRFYYNGSYRLQCGDTCSVTEETSFISIYFDNGSSYFYQYSRRNVVCTDGSSTLIESTLDTASTAQPGTFRIRSRLTNTTSNLARGGADTTTYRDAFRAPPGGVIAFPPTTAAAETIPGDVELRTGPGGVLDLRGRSATNPILVASGTLQIFADQILLDPGVSIEQLFSPPPIVAAGENVWELVLVPARNLCPTTADTPLLAVSVLNLSNTLQDVSLGWFDDLGWVPPFGTGLILQPGETGKVNILIEVPAAAPICDLDTLTISALGVGGASAQIEIRSATLNIDSDGDGLCDWCESCPGRRAGDMTADGTVDLNDVPGFTAALLSPSTLSRDDFCAADLNNDDKINGADIPAFVTQLLP